MAVVTLTSDYGYSSPYTGAVKGAVLSADPAVNVVDITHGIGKHDILQASFFLRNTAYEFPEGTIHLVCIDTVSPNGYFIAESKGHFFVAADNGLFSLLFDEGDSRLFKVKESFVLEGDTFPEKKLFPLLVGHIAKGTLTLVAEPGALLVKKQPLMPVVEEHSIRGSIVYIDGHNNAITNITETLFRNRMMNKNTFAVFYRRKQNITKISRTYQDVKEGNELVLFNGSGYLEIAMNSGEAGQLLGLQSGSQVIIEFYD